jgi:hypothetical protein
MIQNTLFPPSVAPCTRCPSHHLPSPVSVYLLNGVIKMYVCVFVCVCVCVCVYVCVCLCALARAHGRQATGEEK